MTAKEAATTARTDRRGRTGTAGAATAATHRNARGARARDAIIRTAIVAVVLALCEVFLFNLTYWQSRHYEPFIPDDSNTLIGTGLQRIDDPADPDGLVYKVVDNNNATIAYSQVARHVDNVYFPITDVTSELTAFEDPSHPNLHTTKYTLHNLRLNLRLEVNDGGHQRPMKLPQIGVQGQTPQSQWVRTQLYGETTKFQIRILADNDVIIHFRTLPQINVPRPFLLNPVRLAIYAFILVLTLLLPRLRRDWLAAGTVADAGLRGGAAAAARGTGTASSTRGGASTADLLRGIGGHQGTGARTLAQAAAAVGASIRTYRAYWWIVTILGVLFCAAVTLSARPWRILASSEWAPDYEYQWMAQALIDGHANIDYPVASAMHALDNVYDDKQRILTLRALGQTYLFDFAYYNGKYYSYFGVLPCVLFFVPYRLLTGGDLSPWKLNLVVGMALAVLAVTMVRLAFRRWMPHAPLPLQAVVGFAGVCSVQPLMYLSFKSNVYSVPISCALAFALCAVCLWIRAALLDESSRAYWWLLALGGVCVGLALGCRPPVCAVAFLAPVILYPSIVARGRAWIARHGGAAGAGTGASTADTPASARTATARDGASPITATAHDGAGADDAVAARVTVARDGVVVGTATARTAVSSASMTGGNPHDGTARHHRAHPRRHADWGVLADSWVTSGLAVALPALIVALPFLWWNAIRFDNPLDFGANYQLTGTDVAATAAAGGLAKLPYAIWQGLISPAAAQDTFPFLRVVTDTGDFGGTYQGFYGVEPRAGGMLFWVPMAWFMLAFLSRRVRRAAGRRLTVLGTTVLGLGLFVLFLDVIVASLTARYLSDMAYMFVLAGVIGLAAWSAGEEDLIARAAGAESAGRSAVARTSNVALRAGLVVAIATIVLAIASIYERGRVVELINTNPWLYTMTEKAFAIFK